MDRRTAIAQAALSVIARDGLRGLTHRAIDRELDLPEGTTSYYARSRRDLLSLVVERLAERTAADIAPDGPLPTTIDGAVELLTTIFDSVAEREVEARARFALTVDLATNPQLHGMLTHLSQIRGLLLQSGEDVLAALGVPDPAARAVDLVGILNGLLYDRLVGNGRYGTPIDVRHVLTAWLRGVGAAADGTGR